MVLMKGTQLGDNQIQNTRKNVLVHIQYHASKVSMRNVRNFKRSHICVQKTAEYVDIILVYAHKKRLIMYVYASPHDPHMEKCVETLHFRIAKI